MCVTCLYGYVHVYVSDKICSSSCFLHCRHSLNGAFWNFLEPLWKIVSLDIEYHLLYNERQCVSVKIYINSAPYY